MKRLLRVLPLLGLPILLAIGVGVGLLVRPSLDQLFGVAAASSNIDDHADDHADEHEADHLPLTWQGFQNLKLKVAAIETGSFVEQLRMPGEIVELPGVSNRRVAAPTSGRITRVTARPGASVAPGAVVAEIEIIDDALMQAQLKLLELFTQRDIVQSELDRLAPLSDSGGIAGKRRLELEYELRQIDASVRRTEQELVMRGLSTSQIDQIVRSQRAISHLDVVVAAPAPLPAVASRQVLPVAFDEPQDVSLTVESLHIEPGQSVARGELLCELADHRMLLVRGFAFENEVGVVNQAIAERQSVQLEFGAGGDSQRLAEQHIQRIEGHVDEVSQTFRFYVPLRNVPASEITAADGVTYRTWQYRVGQRLHVLIPTNRIEGTFVLPADAVVSVGAESFVFRQLPEKPTYEIHSEYEAVPVTIVAADRDRVAVATDERLAPGDRIAMNSAYQLHLALRAQTGGGAEHHHDH